MDPDWGMRASWNRAAPQLDRVFVRERRSLAIRDEGLEVDPDVEVAMTFRPTSEDWSSLRREWLRLRPHPHILEALGDEGYGLTLRYAAIDWTPEPARSALELTSSIVQIADAYRAIAKMVAPEDLWLFSAPRIFFDLGGAVRLAFSWPGETAKRAYEERDLVFLVGSTLAALFPVAPAPAGKILATCTHVEPKLRYRSLGALQKTCRKTVLMDDPIRANDRLIAWEHVEAGMGFVAVHDLGRARLRFEEALRYDDFRNIATWGQRFASEHVYSRSPRRHFAAPSPRSVSGQLVVPDIADMLAEARRSLTSHDGAHAMSVAQNILRGDPDHADALNVLVSAYFELGQNSEALAYIDALVARAPGEGNFHYLRGKVLFRLGRLAEARDAFERALVLNPTLAEALHLRREVDRAIGSGCKAVGSQHAPVLDIPASLEPLRDVLARGKTREIIDALSSPEHDDNADAQLVLARFLELDGELGRASGIYHRLAEGPDPHRRRALVGKAGLLLQLGLLDSALALFDGVCAEAPSDLDASEGRAQALERLGRLGEAAAEYRRFVGLANARADLRVRVAQQWLDAHVL